MAIVIPNCVRVVLTYSRSTDDDHVNTFHLWWPAPTMGDLESFLESFATALNGTAIGWLNAMPNTSTLKRLTAYDLNPGGWASAEIETEHQGKLGTASAPPQLAVVYTWRTARRGRAFRGRTFYGPVGTAAIGTGGRIGPTHVVDHANRAQNLLTWLATVAQHPLVVASAFSKDHPPQANPVTHVTVDDVFDVQRSRSYKESTRQLRELAVP